MNLDKLKSIHLIGVGGIGLSAIARMMLASGKQVSGSDKEATDITRDLKKKGLDFWEGHNASRVTDDIDLVVYSGAVPEDDPERAKARELGIEELSYPQMLGRVTDGFKRGIAVAGTNGKTTTTALLGLMLEKAGLDPTVIVGSNIGMFGGNYRQGKSDIIVYEACEWNEHFLNYHPWSAIITNIEEDHLDTFKDLNHIQAVFQKFVSQADAHGMLVLNADDAVSQTLAYSGRVIRYGTEGESDLVASNFRIEDGTQLFELTHDGKDLGTFEMRVPGRFNVYNALAAASMAFAIGAEVEPVREALAAYAGAWRRFEILGDFQGATVISDYAHHPTSVQGTIRAAKEFYPDKRIVAVFHPHHQNRTKTLFDDFVASFDQADFVIMNEIFRVPGRDNREDEQISSRDLVRELEKRGKMVVYGKDLQATERLIRKYAKQGDILLVMGAGDIYKIAERLASKGEQSKK